jgi:parallel beta-helix repeat protein
MARSRFTGFRRPKVSKLPKRRRLPRVELLETRQLLSMFYVTNTQDHGTGSLRYEINQVNMDTSSGTDYIEPSGSIGPIILGSGLPMVTRADVTLEDLTIVGNDGTGATGTGTSNSGAPHLSTANGLSLAGTSDAVSSVGISGFVGQGIYVSAGAVTISQSQITNNGGLGIYVTAGAVNISQSQITNSGSDGVQVFGSGAVISDNVFSGNQFNGITLVFSSNNSVTGNIVGLDAAGDAADANGNSGIVIIGGSDNTIGGTSAGEGNIVSGNGADGIVVYGAGDIANGNLIEGNYVGTDATGTFAIGNVSNGVLVFDGASSNTIGPGNVISGNQSAGVYIFDGGTAASANIVQGNLIGTDVTGTVAIGNSLEGVFIGDGASGNMIGGTVSGAANIIAFNGGNGVQVGDDVHDAALKNAILENSIVSNTDLGIDIDNSAPQAAPVLGIALSSSSQTSITGTVTGAHNTTLRVEFFSNPAGTGQGKTYLGFLNVTTSGSGVGSFTFTPASVVAVGLNITATATDPHGNTSEFSAPDNVQAAPVNVNADLSVTPGGFVYNRTTREFCQTITIKNTSGAPIPGPIELELVNLRNATLVNSSGTYQGNPYITILSSGSFGIGQSLTFTLYFSDPTLATISYTSEFLAGPIPPPPPPA